jgi:hypothetical protein
MGHYEDVFYEIYDDIEIKGLKSQFNAQLEKMSLQEKHKSKSVREMWKYAHHKVTSSFNSEGNLD